VVTAEVDWSAVDQRFTLSVKKRRTPLEILFMVVQKVVNLQVKDLLEGDRDHKTASGTKRNKNWMKSSSMGIV
jgi:hypothetical protein